MNRVAIGYSSYNKVALVERSAPPLLSGQGFDLFWADGSTNHEAIELVHKLTDNTETEVHYGVRGGSGPAIVYLLSIMLNNPHYDYIGLVEMDVVLGDRWFERTMELFHIGKKDGLRVGAASPRCYEDRILVQRQGYAVVHNTGAGVIVFTRQAAQAILDGYRVQRTAENRAIFGQLSGVDIAKYWAFRGSDHFLVADWRWDALLASKGYCSLALTPSPVEMIGQTPSLSEQGLTLSTGPVAAFDLPRVFDTYRDRLKAIREGNLRMPDSKFYGEPGGFTIIFPHQIASLGGSYKGDWRLRDSPGFGPFAWKSGEGKPSMTAKVFGPCEILFSGGEDGGQIRVVDELSGYDASPTLGPEGATGMVSTVNVPGIVSYRNITITAMTPGVCFFGLRVRESQPIVPATFTYADLPPV